MACWNKITTLEEDSHHLVDGNSLQLTTKTAPRTRHIWAARLASIKILTGTVTEKGGAWPTPELPRGCGHRNEYREHLFQWTKEEKNMEQTSGKTVGMGSKEQSSPPDHIHRPAWHILVEKRKYLLSSYPHSLPVARAFENQTKIGCLKALMGLLENNCPEIQTPHLQSLVENTSGKIWISLLIRKIWDVAWDFWNFRNHNLHAK